MKTILMAVVALAGCVNTNHIQQFAHSDPKVSYLCIGMEMSRRFGSCPGCELDAKRLSALIRGKYGYAGETLISENATKSEVVKRLKAGIERTPEDGLFLFFYSGHGGREMLGGKEPDGADRHDEYLCLYDSHMTDDEIWDIVSKCKGRVFMYFDACHSATMYRSVSSEIGKDVPMNARAMSHDVNGLARSCGFTFRPERFVKASAMDASGQNLRPRLLCWSGCKEEEYSYGGKNGGTLTICVIASWKSGITYDALWSKTRANVLELQPVQHPVQTVVGDFQKSAEAFR